MIKEIVDLFFPRVCEVCGEVLLRDEEQICLSCYSDLPLSFFWGWSGNPAEVRFYGRIKIERAISLFIYREDSVYDELIWKFKYKGKRALGSFLGRELGRYMKNSSLNGSIDFIIPIPLHPFKKFKRGYNQALIVAKEISAEIGAPLITDVLKRGRYTSSQARKGAEERWSNVADAFVVKNRDLIEGKHLLIVDDVLTTGSTIEAAASEILKANNCRLSIASLAFVE